jgi:hypothetical protein
MHGPQFPSRLLLHLDIANPLATISVYEKLLWDEEVEFHGVPKRDIEKVERVELECDLSPNLHFMMEERQYEHQEEMDEWMASQLDWIRYDLLKEARALKEVRLRLTVGLESELEALEKQLPILEDWEEVKRIECVYEWRHGMRAWMGCDHGHSGESLRRVTVERRGGEWVVEKVFGRD